MRHLAFLLAFIGFAAAAVAADDAVEITPPVLKAGDRYKVTKSEKTKTVEALEAGGKKTSKDREETKLVVFTEEVVTPGAAGEKPSALVRVYEKYEGKGGKDAAAPPLDTPITIAKKDGKFSFNADKPLGEYAKRLDDEFNKPDEPSTKDFLPGKPVKPGDAWKIDPAKFVKSLAGDKMTVDGAKSSLGGKLLKAYKKDGKQFGVMELSAEFPLKDLGKDAPPLKSGQFKMTATSDVCIDGTDVSEVTKSVLKFEVVIETKEVTIVVTSDGATTTTKVALPKK